MMEVEQIQYELQLCIMVTDKLVETWNENSGGGVVRQ